jgi:prevent-host-death family protein
MSKHSVAEAKNMLPELIARAERGEEIIVTRHGHPVVRMSALERAPQPITDADLARLAKRRKGRGKILAEDAGTFISRMRDEEWAR